MQLLQFGWRRIFVMATLAGTVYGRHPKALSSSTSFTTVETDRHIYPETTIEFSHIQDIQNQDAEGGGHLFEGLGDGIGNSKYIIVEPDFDDSLLSPGVNDKPLLAQYDTFSESLLQTLTLTTHTDGSTSLSTTITSSSDTLESSTSTLQTTSQQTTTTTQSPIETSSSRIISDITTSIFSTRPLTTTTVQAKTTTTTSSLSSTQNTNLATKLTKSSSGTQTYPQKVTPTYKFSGSRGFVYYRRSTFVMTLPFLFSAIRFYLSQSV